MTGKNICGDGGAASYEGALPPCPEAGRSALPRPWGAIEVACTGATPQFAIATRARPRDPPGARTAAGQTWPSPSQFATAREITMHFCGVAHARRALPDE
jgi:hypothetical protein